MAQVTIKYTNLAKASIVLATSVRIYQKFEKMPESTVVAGESYEVLLETAQRSLIQAFEVMIDAFWKCIKWLLEEHFHIAVGIINPRNVITKACEIRFLTEAEAALLLELTDYRNKTSHIYKQEVADFITKEVLRAWPQIDALVQRCDPSKL